MPEIIEYLSEIATQLEAVINGLLLVFEDDHKRYHERKVKLTGLLDRCEQILEAIGYTKEPDTLPEPIPEREESEPEEDKYLRTGR